MKKQFMKMIVSLCAILCMSGISLFAYAETINVTEIDTTQGAVVISAGTYIKNNTEASIYVWSYGPGENPHPAEIHKTNDYSFPPYNTSKRIDSNMSGSIDYDISVSINELFPIYIPTLVSAPAHTHNFVTGIIYDATCDHDGLEGTYCKTCGYILNSSPISAFGYTLETYAQQKIEASKSGQKIVLEFGELNSFPKSFMEKIAARVAEGVTFEFRYNVNHKLQKITIPAYSTVDTNLDWYGPATMEQLYGAN